MVKTELFLFGWKKKVLRKNVITVYATVKRYNKGERVNYFQQPTNTE